MKPAQLFAIVVLLGSFTVYAQQERIPYIAVNNFLGHGVPASEVATLTEVLANGLIETKKFRVMERGQMQEILKEQAFQQSGACSEDACLVEMGQVLGIEQIVAGSIGKVGQAYSITIRLISVATGEIVRNVSHTYTGPVEGLLTNEMTVVAKKLAGIEPVFSPKKQTKSAKPLVVGGLIVGGLALAGAGVYFLLPKDPGTPSNTTDQSATMEVIW